MNEINAQTSTQKPISETLQLKISDIKIIAVKEYFNQNDLRLIQKLFFSIMNPTFLSQRQKIKIFFQEYENIFLTSTIFDVITSITCHLIINKDYVFISTTLLSDFIDFVMVSVLGISKHDKDKSTMTYVVESIIPIIKPIQNDEQFIIGLNLKFLLEKDSVIACQYLVLDILGKGVYGDVYLIKDIFTDQIFAFKLFKEPIDCDTEIANLCHLANISNVVKPVSVIEIIFFGVAFCGYLMPYFDAGTLEEYAKKHSLHERTPEKRNKLLSIFWELLEILRKCHELGVCHNDIKPHNILMTEDGHPHIADWGLSSVSPDKLMWYTDIDFLIVSKPFRDPFTWSIFNQKKQMRKGEKQPKYRASFLADIWEIILCIISILSNDRYLKCPIFDVFQNGGYFKSFSQILINKAIDSVLDESEQAFNHFLKKWLDIRVFMTLNEVPQNDSNLLLRMYDELFEDLKKFFQNEPERTRTKQKVKEQVE